MLQLLIGSLAGTPAGDRVTALLRERSTLQDGQEDPGAVETLGLGVEFAVAAEIRHVVDGLASDANALPPSTADPFDGEEEAEGHSVRGSSDLG